jgi:hypothetical protein
LFSRKNDERTHMYIGRPTDIPCAFHSISYLEIAMNMNG